MDEIKTLVRGAYDFQKTRIQLGLRIIANFKARLGQKPGQKEKTLGKDEKRILDTIRKNYRRMSDGWKKFPNKKSFKGDAVIGTYAELCMAEQYDHMLKTERKNFERIKPHIHEHPLWIVFLKDVLGCGETMAGVILSEIDIHKAKYPSSLYRYAGLDVGPDGLGRSRKQAHLEKQNYIDKNGKEKERMGLTFNPLLKTKLIGVLGPCLMRASAESKYRKSYNDYKHRMENHERWGIRNDAKKDQNGNAVTSKLRRHNQAIRYMVKLFLADLYKAWRDVENLPVHKPYGEAKLGIKHREAS